MLYVTSRNNSDVYTAQRVLSSRRGPDGGLYIPFRLPRLSREEVLELGRKPFGSCVAQALNLLFNTRLTGFDVDLAAGRYCVRLEKNNQRILLAECWHNPQWQFSFLAESLSDLVSAEKGRPYAPGDWAGVAVRIAVLFGIFGELIRSDIADADRPVDISVVSGDMSSPMAAWYAREMGLPVGNIVCCCNENGNLWDFICHGQLRTDTVARSTIVPQADIAVPVCLEMLIAAAGGYTETERYMEALRKGCSYFVSDAVLHRLRQGIYVTVSSEKRILQTIPGVYRTHGCILSPETALAYAGLLDYRARTAESRMALILSETSPCLCSSTVAAAMDISEAALSDMLGR